MRTTASETIWIINCGKINLTPTFPQINRPLLPDNPRSRGSYQRFSFKKGVLKSSQKSQENNCSRVSFLKKRLNEHLWWLLLMMQVTFFKNRAKKVQNVFLQRLCWYKSEWYISLKIALIDKEHFLTFFDKEIHRKR